jgi:hypothetical protein
MTDAKHSLKERVSIAVSYLLPVIYILQYIPKMVSVWYYELADTHTLVYILLSLIINLLFTMYGMFNNNTAIIVLGLCTSIISVFMIVQYVINVTKKVKSNVSYIQNTYF